MLRLLLSAVWLLTVIFAGVIAGMRVQQPARIIRDDFSGCGAPTLPCWQGVQPGVTRQSDARRELSARGWALRGQCNAAVYDGCDLFTHDGDALVAYLYIGADQVKQIALFRSGLRLGDLWLALGSPEYAAIAPRSYRAASLNTALWFSPSAISTRMNFPCPAGFAEMLRIPVDTILVWASGTAMQGTLFGSVGELRQAIHEVCAA